MIEMRAVFSGRVQGIGFRWTVSQHADRLQLTGWVCNCSDGTVELVAHGTKKDLESLIDSIKKEPGYAVIENCTTEFREATSIYHDFRVLGKKMV